MRYMISDISTAPIEGCEQWLEPSKAPSTWKDPKKIADHIAEKDAERLEKAALDPDLSRITGLGLLDCDTGEISVTLCQTVTQEHDALVRLAAHLRNRVALIGYNSLRFDWPFLARRGQYLGVKLRIDTDRFRSDNRDLSELLTHRGLLTPKSLSFFVRRLQWTDLAKPLSGAEESRVLTTGLWTELDASIRHDLEATHRLAKFLGVLSNDEPMVPVDAMSTEQIF